MVSTVAQRQAKSIRKVTETYYEVVGSTGNVYYYDAWADSCNCPAGQNGKDCYHAADARKFIAAEKEQQFLMEKEFSHSIKGADIQRLASDLGLDTQFTPGITDFDGDKPGINSCIAGRRVVFSHMGELLATILFSYPAYTVLHASNGRIHSESTTTVDQLRTDLTRMLNYKFKQARESLFWGDDKQDYPEKPRLKTRK